ncbi:MAG: restriction endonuclease subunit S [Planctomycetota bacterium]
MTQSDAHPAGWTRRSLGDLATVHMGQSPPGKSVNDTGDGVPFLQGNAEFGTTSPTATHWCTQPGRIAEEGDLLISVRAPVGELNIADQRYCIGRGLGAIRIAEDDRAFLWAALHFERRRLNRVSQGSTFDAIGRDDLEQLPLLCPPLGERRRIAETLGAVDAAIDATRGVIEQTRRLKTAVLQDFLTRGLPGRHSEFREVKGLGQVPRAWKRMPLSKAVSYWQYGLSESLSDSGAYPCFRMNNYRNGRMVASDLKYIDLSDKALGTYRLERGDILFNRTNSRDLVGKIGIFDLDGDYVFASYLVRLRTNPSIARPEFLNLLLNTAVNQERIRRLATPGVSQSNINVESLKQFRVALPSTDEQDTMIEFIAGLDDRRDREIETQRQLVDLKTALSQALLTGRVRMPAAKGVPVAS